MRRSLALGCPPSAPHAIDLESDSLVYAMKSRVAVVRGALSGDRLLAARIDARVELSAVELDGRDALFGSRTPSNALGFCDLEAPSRALRWLDWSRDALTVRWLSVDRDRVLALALDAAQTSAWWLAFDRPLSKHTRPALRVRLERTPAFMDRAHIGDDPRRIAIVSETSERGLLVDLYDRGSLALAESITVPWPHHGASAGPPQFRSLDLRDERLLAGFERHGLAAMDVRDHSARSAPIATRSSGTALVRATLVSAGEALCCVQRAVNDYVVERASLGID